MIPTGKPTSVVPKGLILASSGSGTAEATRATKPILQEFVVSASGLSNFGTSAIFHRAQLLNHK